MKSVLISIKPKWCEKIASGEKTIEVRKSAPQEVPFKAYIYCTNGEYSPTNCGKKSISDCLILNRNVVNGKVIGEFICDKVDTYYYRDFGYEISEETFNKTMLTGVEFCGYGNGKTLYGWHISDLKIYDKPRELSEFYTIDKSGDDCCIACVYHETPIEEMPCRTCTGERRYLYRPPQSWQYVE